MKRRFCAYLFILSLLICGALFGVNYKGAKLVRADELTTSTFKMQEGVAYRSMWYKNMAGTVYTAEISKTEGQALLDAGYTANLFIAPYSYITGLEGASASFYAEAKTLIGQGKYVEAFESCGLKKIVVENMTPLIVGDKMYIRGGVKAFIYENLSKDYFGIAYFEYDDGETVTRKYAALPDDRTTLVRSMAYVTTTVYSEGYSSGRDYVNVLKSLINDSVASTIEVKGKVANLDRSSVALFNEEGNQTDNDVFGIDDFSLSYFDNLPSDYNLYFNYKLKDGTDGDTSATTLAYEYKNKVNFDLSGANSGVVSYSDGYFHTNGLGSTSIAASILGADISGIGVTVQKADLSDISSSYFTLDASNINVVKTTDVSSAESSTTHTLTVLPDDVTRFISQSITVYGSSYTGDNLASGDLNNTTGVRSKTATVTFTGNSLVDTPTISDTLTISQQLYKVNNDNISEINSDVASCGNVTISGTVNSSSWAEKDATITIGYDFNDSYEYKANQLYVTYSDGTDTSGRSTYSFMMPNENITVGATASVYYDVVVNQPSTRFSNTVVTANKTKAIVGETVTLSNNSVYGYTFNNYTVNGASSSASFTVPKVNGSTKQVTVSASISSATVTATLYHKVNDATGAVSWTSQTVNITYGSSATVYPLTNSSNPDYSTYSGLASYLTPSNASITINTADWTSNGSETITYGLNEGVSVSGTVPALPVVQNNKGVNLSFTLASSGYTDWHGLFKIPVSATEYYVLYNGPMRHYTYANSAWSYSEITELDTFSYYGWDCMVPGSRNGAVSMVISINSDGTIDMYRGGIRQIHYYGTANGQSVSSWASAMLSAIRANGFVVLNGTAYNAVANGEWNAGSSFATSTIGSPRLSYQASFYTNNISYQFANYSGGSGAGEKGHKDDETVYTLQNTTVDYDVAMTGYNLSGVSLTNGKLRLGGGTYNVTYTSNHGTFTSSKTDDILVAEKGVVVANGNNEVVRLNSIGTGDFYVEIKLKDVYCLNSYTGSSWADYCKRTFGIGIQDCSYSGSTWYWDYARLCTVDRLCSTQRQDRNNFGRWTGGSNNTGFWWLGDSVFYNVTRHRMDATLMVTRNGTTFNVMYNFYSYYNSTTYNVNYRIEDLTTNGDTQSIKIFLMANDSSYTVDYIKFYGVSYDFGSNLGFDTDDQTNHWHKGYTKLNSESQNKAWYDNSLFVGKDDMVGTISGTISLYQEACRELGGGATTRANVGWRTPLVLFYNWNNYDYITCLRQDQHYFVGDGGRSTGTVTSVTSSHSNIFSESGANNDQLYDLLYNAYIVITFSGTNVGINGSLTVKMQFYPMNVNYTESYWVQYVLSDMPSYFDIKISCERSSFMVYQYSLTSSYSNVTFDNSGGGWSSRVTTDYAPGNVLQTSKSFTATMTWTQTRYDNGSAWGDNCWRTPLLILYRNGNSDNRAVFRQDWWSWTDGSGIGIAQGIHQDGYYSSSSYDQVLSRFTGVTVTLTITCVANTSIRIVMVFSKDSLTLTYGTYTWASGAQYLKLSMTSECSYFTVTSPLKVRYS